MRQGSTLSYLFANQIPLSRMRERGRGEGEDRYTSAIAPTSYRYTGQRVETSLGLYYYGARWYDPALGRFVQADTVVASMGDPQSWDRYAYVNNNPVRFTDPSGHIPVCEGKVSCSDQWRQAKALDRLGEIGFMKYEIRYEFGIKMEESG